MDDGGEADDNGSLDAGRPEEVGAAEVSDVMSALVEALCTGAACMDDALRNSLSGEVRYLLDQMVVLQQDWPCQIPSEQVGLQHTEAIYHLLLPNNRTIFSITRKEKKQQCFIGNYND